MLGTEFVSPLPRFKEEEQKNKGKNEMKEVGRTDIQTVEEWKRCKFLLMILTLLSPYYHPSFYAHYLISTCFNDPRENHMCVEYEYLLKCIFVLN